MHIGLFAAREVGYEVAKFFGDNHEPIECLVLDAEDKTGLNGKIIKNSGCEENRVFYSDTLYSSRTRKVFAEAQLDLIVLAWWPYYIEESVRSLPCLGCLNFHPSYLPYGRGKASQFLGYC